MDDLKDDRFRVVCRDEGDVTVIQFTIRRMVSAEDVEAIGDRLEQLVDVENRIRLVLDLGLVDFPSSAFLGRVLWTLIKLKRRQGRLALCHLSHSLSQMFQPGQQHEPDRLGIFVDEASAIAWASRG